MNKGISAATQKRKDMRTKTEELTKAAIESVNVLSIHLRDSGDLPRMYKANRALHALWEIK